MSDDKIWTRALALMLMLAIFVGTPASATSRRVFVSSASGTGNLAAWPRANGHNGLAAGDAICQSLAHGEDLPNSAAYRAWLSSSTTDAFCHVLGHTGTRATNCNGAVVGSPALGPWVRMDGSPWAGDLIALTSRHEIYNAVMLDEHQSVLYYGDGSFWTGSADSGALSATGQTCSDWTSPGGETYGTYGYARATGSEWTQDGDWNCDLYLHLLCLETGVGDATPFPALDGSLAFITSVTGAGRMSDWPESLGLSGLAGADQVCRTLATDAGLTAPDSFVAWMSDADTDVADRVTSTGPFRRLDGVPVALDRGVFLDYSLISTVTQTERGDYVGAGSENRAYTGGTGGFGDDYCQGWTSSQSTAYATSGEATSLIDWLHLGATACDIPEHLYCFSNLVTLFADGFEDGTLGRWTSNNF